MQRVQERRTRLGVRRQVETLQRRRADAMFLLATVHSADGESLRQGVASLDRQIAQLISAVRAGGEMLLES
jgi:hypothetical protein